MEKVILKAKCRTCKEVHELEVSQQGLVRYEKGRSYIQDCFPELTVDERELLISGTCGTCFDKMFGEE